jgi:hypothetical protein
MMPRISLAIVAAMVLFGCSEQPAPQPPQETAAAPSQPATGPVAPPTTDEEMIRSAVSAAPESVGGDATVIAVNASGEVRTLRQGTNLWTCIPDGPSPGVDPMCLDQGGLEWVQAWLARRNPPANKMGFGYMLLGGSDASNEDPFATAPAAGHAWVDTGPHVMVFNIGTRFEGYPATHDDPTKPFVMFPNTPYAHLMIPVK